MYAWWWWASKTLLKIMIVARDTLIQVYITTDPGTRIELNLVTEICVPRSILGEYHPYHAKLYLMYIGN